MVTESQFLTTDLAEAEALGSNVAESMNKTGNALGVTAKGIMRLSRNVEVFTAFGNALSAAIQPEGRTILVNAIKMACSRSHKAAAETFKDTGQCIEFAKYSWKKNEPLTVNWLTFVPEAADKAKPEASPAKPEPVAEVSDKPGVNTQAAEIVLLESMLADVTAERDALQAEVIALRAQLAEVKKAKPRKRAA